jgi:hypothetical protein
MAHPAEVWAKIRADYEVRGLSFRALAKTYSVALGAISKRAKNEHWKQAESEHLVKKKTKAIKDIISVEEKKRTLPEAHQQAIEQGVDQALRVDGLRTEAQVALLSRIAQAAKVVPVETPKDVESLANASARLAGGERAQQATTVNVLNNAQAAANAQSGKPFDFSRLAPEIGAAVDAEVERQEREESR